MPGPSYSQKYCLVCFVEPMAVGSGFTMSEWPLHVTLADVFAVDLAGTQIEAKLAAIMAEQTPIIVTADKESTLGNIPVVLIQRSVELVALHNKVMGLLEQNGAMFNRPGFTREGFLPHCTIQKTGCLNTGQELIINSLALVDMFPRGDWQHRKVIRVFATRSW